MQVNLVWRSALVVLSSSPNQVFIYFNILFCSLISHFGIFDALTYWATYMQSINHLELKFDKKKTQLQASAYSQAACGYLCEV